MIAGRLPSLTAMIVACARGMRGGPDDLSHRLVPRPIDRALRGAMAVASFGLVPHLERRTRAIDAVVGDGRAQLVILGAGLDARAHRLEELAGTAVFEVDHPSTQRYKKPRAAGLPRRCRSLAYVSVDFERDDLHDRLAASGHDAGAPTLWIWEGVTMYLTREAMTTTLAAIAARSCAGSTLALTYATADLAEGSEAIRALRPLVGPAFSVLGEPLRGLCSPEEIGALVEAHGFRPASDTGPRDWARDGGSTAPALMVAERLLVAERIEG